MEYGPSSRASHLHTSWSLPLTPVTSWLLWSGLLTACPAFTWCLLIWVSQFPLLFLIEKCFLCPQNSHNIWTNFSLFHNLTERKHTSPDHILPNSFCPSSLWTNSLQNMVFTCPIWPLSFPPGWTLDHQPFLLTASVYTILQWSLLLHVNPYNFNASSSVKSSSFFFV